MWGRSGEGHCQATPLSPVNGPFIFSRITQMPYCCLNRAKYSPNKDWIVTVFLFGRVVGEKDSSSSNVLLHENKNVAISHYFVAKLAPALICLSPFHVTDV